jgi:hypothetical protein
VQRATHLLNPFTVSRRVHTVREDRDVQVLRRIDPQ